MTENLQLLQDKKITMVNTSKIATISDSVTPMLHALTHLNTKTKDVPTKRDIHTVMTYLYDNEQALDKSIEEMFEVSRAMFATAIQYMVARSIIKKECLENCPQTSSGSSNLHPRRALLQQLQADDSEDDHDVAQQATTSVRKTPKRTVSEDSEASPSQEVEETTAPKWTKSKKSKSKGHFDLSNIYKDSITKIRL
ncbi:Hypothetical predicted protein [Paramuricea clavata]|uniref:Uncharacterized protein n=1 Tax=Paramuricea clavata TaxID=317549 RepID=A0A6S7GJP3_PARCT|nr:Hypothetical predicted protein [Paramuricea clavata]